MRTSSRTWRTQSFVVLILQAALLTALLASLLSASGCQRETATAPAEEAMEHPAPDAPSLLEAKAKYLLVEAQSNTTPMTFFGDRAWAFQYRRENSSTWTLVNRNEPATIIGPLDPDTAYEIRVSERGGHGGTWSAWSGATRMQTLASDAPNAEGRPSNPESGSTGRTLWTRERCTRELDDLTRRADALTDRMVDMLHEIAGAAARDAENIARKAESVSRQTNRLIVDARPVVEGCHTHLPREIGPLGALVEDLNDVMWDLNAAISSIRRSLRTAP